jgi:cytoskeletal protein RodZ
MDILSGSTEALLSRMGSRLRQLRLEANLSREQLAAETGV